MLPYLFRHAAKDSVCRSVNGCLVLVRRFRTIFRCRHNLPGAGSLVLYECRFAGRSQNL